MQNLTVTGIQCDLAWEDKARNLERIDRMLEASAPGSDLVVLPEMFTTAFSMEPARLAETMDGPAIKWMFAQCQRYGIALCGSLIIEEDGHYFNRFIWVDADGRLYQYDKRHLFSLLGEEKPYTPGREHCLLEYRGWKIQPFICYDLRFPVWCRNALEADLQLYVANWPERRSEHWKHLLKARAIENQCYTLGVNRVGKDANGINHTGDSGAYDFYGRELATVHGEERAFTVTLNLDGVVECREKFPFLKDRDRFDIL